jgi:hypothetical protein
VRDPAVGNQIDASGGDDRGSLKVDPPGGFGNGAGQAVDLRQFTSLGIDPARYRTIAVESMQHFRAAFEPIARAVVLVDAGALCSEIYTPELFTKVRRPVWLLDPTPFQRSMKGPNGRKIVAPCNRRSDFSLSAAAGGFAAEFQRGIGIDWRRHQIAEALLQ